MSARDPLVELREADAALRGVRVPPDVDARVRASFERAGTRRRVAPPMAAAFAAAVLVVLVVGALSFVSPSDASAPGAEAQGKPRAVEVLLGAGGRVEERDGAYVLLSGSATFDVTPRAPGEPPVIVQIADAHIEVMGTRFVVTRREREGHVKLLRGVVRVVDADGLASVLSPGQERTFSLWEHALAQAGNDVVERVENAPPPSPPPRAMAPRPRTMEPEPRTAPADRPEPEVAKEVPSAAEVEVGVARVAALRSAGDDAGALAEIDRLLALALERRTAETLSFEKGLVLERLDDERACEHWAAHARGFEGGRYDDAVARALERLACGGR